MRKYITEKIQLPTEIAEGVDYLASLCDLTPEQYLSAFMIGIFVEKGWINLHQRKMVGEHDKTGNVVDNKQGNDPDQGSRLDSDGNRMQRSNRKPRSRVRD